MRLALVVLVLTLPAASPARTPGLPGVGRTAALAPICRQDLKVRPIRAGEAARARRLTNLPAGNLTLTVLNRVGDCTEPVTIGRGYGALEEGR